MKGLLTVLTVAMIPAFGLDLATVKAEPNLEKRAEKAFLYCGEVLTVMRQELDSSDLSKIKGQLTEFEAALDLAVESLKATGKNARKNPKHFKRAEQAMRELNRRLESLRRDMNVDDRHVVEPVMANLSKKIDEVVEATLRGS